MLKDCVKAAEISHGQRNTERRTNEQLVKELESMINFLHIEVQEKNKIILSLLPESEGFLTENVTVIFFTITQLTQLARYHKAN